MPMTFRAFEVAATGEFSVWATAAKPGGCSTMRSPWLIQTANDDDRPLKTGCLASRCSSMACPYSRLLLGSTLPPKLVNDRLHPIANAEDGEALVEHPRWGQRRAEVIDARRAAGKDHALGVEVYNFIPVGGVLDQLTVDVRFPHSPRDQAAVLGAEVDDQDRLALSVMG